MKHAYQPNELYLMVMKSPQLERTRRLLFIIQGGRALVLMLTRVCTLRGCIACTTVHAIELAVALGCKQLASIHCKADDYRD